MVGLAVLLALLATRGLAARGRHRHGAKREQVRQAQQPAADAADEAPERHHAPQPSAALSASSPWASPEACEAFLKSVPGGSRKHAPGIASWNLAWFPDGAANGPSSTHLHDVPWLACAMAALDVQVLAVQEVVQHARGRAALLDLLQGLSERTHGDWKAELDECPDDGRQHVGFLYDATRVTLRELLVLGELNPGRSACDRRLRPGLGARLQWRDGPSLLAITVHLDSGQTARDYDNRQLSLKRLQVRARLLFKSSALPVLALGDFNTMGCERCEPKIAADAERDALRAPTDDARDAATPVLARLTAERDCTEYYHGHGSTLDHALWMQLPAAATSAALPRASVQGVCAELRCERLSRAQEPEALMHLSDHCPLLVDLPQPAHADLSSTAPHAAK